MLKSASHWSYCFHRSTVAGRLRSKGTSASLPAILVEMPWPSRCRAHCWQRNWYTRNCCNSCCFILVNVVNGAANAISPIVSFMAPVTTLCAPPFRRVSTRPSWQPDPNNVPCCAVVDTLLICKVQIIFTSLESTRRWRSVCGTQLRAPPRAYLPTTPPRTAPPRPPKQVDISHHAINPFFKLNY